MAEQNVKSGSKEINELLDKCRRLGCTIERTAKNHIKITHPLWDMTVYTASTPSDNWRGVSNACRFINQQNRKAGLEVI